MASFGARTITVWPGSRLHDALLRYQDGDDDVDVVVVVVVVLLETFSSFSAVPFRPFERMFFQGAVPRNPLSIIPDRGDGKWRGLEEIIAPE